MCALETRSPFAESEHKDFVRIEDLRLIIPVWSAPLLFEMEPPPVSEPEPQSASESEPSSESPCSTVYSSPNGRPFDGDGWYRREDIESAHSSEDTESESGNPIS